MRIVNTIEELRTARRELAGLAFVPTMGNLHSGHVALFRLAREQAKHVAASIFVNRLQFAPHEDFDSYPRTFEDDCARLRAEGVELLFAPDETVLYPVPQGFIVEPPAIANELEGAFRPRFFHGVSTVVLKLLNCVQPDAAVFGKKDFQQLMIIRNMVSQLDLPVRIIAGETVREADGLALSSRNRFLSAAERAEAPRLHTELLALKARAVAGDTAFETLCANCMQTLSSAGWKPDYVSVRRRDDLAPARIGETRLVVLAAARIGATRLIDNLEF